jgi:hypothetical protein
MMRIAATISILTMMLLLPGTRMNMPVDDATQECPETSVQTVMTENNSKENTYSDLIPAESDKPQTDAGSAITATGIQDTESELGAIVDDIDTEWYLN